MCVLSLVSRAPTKGVKYNSELCSPGSLCDSFIYVPMTKKKKNTTFFHRQSHMTSEDFFLLLAIKFLQNFTIHDITIYCHKNESKLIIEHIQDSSSRTQKKRFQNSVQIKRSSSQRVLFQWVLKQKHIT